MLGALSVKFSSKISQLYLKIIFIHYPLKRIQFRLPEVTWWLLMPEVTCWLLMSAPASSRKQKRLDALHLPSHDHLYLTGQTLLSATK